MNNEFVNQFSDNIKFDYASFDRVIIRGYIRKFFSLGFIVTFLKSISSKRHFENPIISKSFKRDLQNNVAQPSNIEEEYSLLHKGLGLITHELAIAIDHSRR